MENHTKSKGHARDRGAEKMTKTEDFLKIIPVACVAQVSLERHQARKNKPLKFRNSL